MNSDDQVRKERFLLLLDQIGIPGELRPHLGDGRVQKLAIDKNNRSWHFYFSLPKPMPANVYTFFRRELHRHLNI